MLSALSGLMLLITSPLSAQEPGWNSTRALELIERARVRREQPHADTTLQNYRADAGGYVYFYLDRQGSEERTLVKVDQIALELYWGAPSSTKQRIVGLRDESRLPNRQHYHLDHLTVVQDEFGDVIRIGDGDEVRDVPHPASAVGGAVYDFNLADSLTINVPGASTPVRVYELHVRPKQRDRPGFVGSVFVDRASADIVRMTFTFTPASYVDRRLDYIHISLDNALWDNQYWLPHEQRVEIRRQLPELDFVAGAVIKGVIRVRDYVFNVPLPDNFFTGPTVVALPESMRRAYPFDEELYAGLEVEGLAPPPEMAELRRRAAQLIGARYLSGLPRLRLHVRNASSAVRYDRAEGLFVGAGAGYAPAPWVVTQLTGGYAFGADQGSAALRVTGTPRASLRMTIDGHVNELRDIGPYAALPRFFNTVSSLFFGDDYLDPYFATGGRLALERTLAPRWTGTLELTLEKHESAVRVVQHAPLDENAPFRAVRRVDDGNLRSASLDVQRVSDSGTAWTSTVAWHVEAGAHRPESGAAEADAFARSMLDLSGELRSADRGSGIAARLRGGAVSAGAPAQRLFLFGGPGTLPGYAARSFGADRFALAQLDAYRDIAAPWLRLHALASAAWGTTRSQALPLDWGVTSPERVRSSVGVGAGLIYDIVRLDVAKGVNGGHWQFLVSVRPDLWDIL